MPIRDIEKGFAAAAARAGAAEEAAAFIARVKKVSHIPGLIKAVGKMDLPRALLPPAREALKDCTPRDFVDFQIVYGLAGLLASDGSKPSMDVLEGFAERAQKAARDNTVIDPKEILGRIIKALGRGAAAGTLRKKLAEHVEARRDQTEVVALMKRLAPVLAKRRGWRIQIWIGLGAPNPWFGMLQKGPRVLLALDPDDKTEWHVEVKSEPKGLYGAQRQYSNRIGDVSQDDFGLPKLERLDAFPSWLEAAGKKLRVRFSVNEALIEVGRQKSVVAPVRAWLASAG